MLGNGHFWSTAGSNVSSLSGEQQNVSVLLGIYLKEIIGHILKDEDNHCSVNYVKWKIKSNLNIQHQGTTYILVCLYSGMLARTRCGLENHIC